MSSANAEKEFAGYTAAKVKDVYDQLRNETDQIENNIAVGEKEVLAREQMAFLMRQHELELANLQSAHLVDMQKRKDAAQAVLIARNERKKAKRDARTSIRASKRRDQVTSIL